MNTIVQLNYEELQTAVKSCMEDVLKEFQGKKPELPDRIGFEEALEHCRKNGISISKSKGYKMSMNGEWPCKKFGRKLVFSRKGLDVWIEENTKGQFNAGDEMSDRLAKSAKRKV